MAGKNKYLWPVHFLKSLFLALVLHDNLFRSSLLILHWHISISSLFKGRLKRSALMKTAVYPLIFSYSIVQEIVWEKTIDLTINKQQLRQHLAVLWSTLVLVLLTWKL